ncbi:MAG TPA: metal-dependent phosphohydrolase [Clostridium sp.]|jgi:HD-like signal output (HDOD) protein|nr:HDOD domain-containing protein [Clostridia bacterium]HCW05515.1 metal-dependent phosphohydrolase [Clostridium sp.]
MNSEKIIGLLEEAEWLPKINRNILEIISLIDSSDKINMEVLADKIQKCGNLRESLLANVNSGYFRLKRTVNSLSEAVVYLGTKAVERLIIAHLVKALIPDRIGRAKNLNREKYWKHSLGTSIAANILAEKLGYKDKYKYFAYGLIHDIGTVVLDVCLPELVDEVVLKQSKGLHQIVAERLVMKGFTHEHAGAWQCEKLRLPEDIRVIVEHHHTPLQADKYKDEVYIMSIADAISSLYYERLLCMHTNYVLNERVMEYLGLTYDDIEEISKILPQKVEEAHKLFNFNLIY